MTTERTDERGGDRNDDDDLAVDRRSVLRAVGAGAGLAAGRSTGLLDGDGPLGGADGDAPSGLDMLDARVEATERSGLLATGGPGEKYDRSSLVAKAGCFDPNAREIYGPTDINAQTGNGRLSVALNDAGTMTVFRWPYPSFYDQLKYFTTGRDADDAIQVPENEGAFLGLAVDTGDGFETTWLRDAEVVEQYYASDRDGDEGTGADYSDEIVTVYDLADADLRVTVRDLVTREGEGEPELDALARKVRVVRRGDSPAEAVKLLAYENVNLVVEKRPQYPVQDWCTEENNQDLAMYDGGLDAIVHRKTGVDSSVGEERSVAVAMGFAGESDGHQVGGDAYEPAAAPVASRGPFRDAYDDASTGTLSGNAQYAGQTTGALSTELDLGGGEPRDEVPPIGASAGGSPVEPAPGGAGVAEETVVFAAGATPADAATALGTVRGREFEALRADKEAWFDDLVGDAPLPDREAMEAADGVDADALLKLCRRSLATLVTITEDTDNRATVASIATQAPYGEDWVRDGAYFNLVLELAGLDEWVSTHNRWYADIQQATTDPEPTAATAPPGNWNMNYYGDGVAGGPIPFEIDETAYGIWTLYEHYERLQRIGSEDAEAYLADVYPAIQRAGDYLVRCRDPETGLHCPSWEDDRFAPRRATIVGAATVWLGLKSATAAARAAGNDADADSYEQRQHELGRAIDAELFDPETEAYGPAGAGFPMAEVVWPCGFTPYTDPDSGELMDEPQVDDPYDHPRIRSHLDAVYESVQPAFLAPDPEGADTGQYEVKGLTSLAKGRRESGPGSLDDVARGLDWIATEHATDTHVMGEAWKVFEGADGEREVRSIVSQPHAWEQILVYICALEAFPPADVEPEDGVGGVLAELR
jgi:hypothetical protein